LREQTILRGTLRLVVANPNAMLQNRRFIDSDLNRSFPGKEGGGIEEQLAFQLRQKLSDSDALIDLHSTTANTPPFIITRQDNEYIRKLANVSSIERVVVKPKPSKMALIDYGENRVGIELGKHDSDETFAYGLSATIGALSEFGMINREGVPTDTSLEIFVVEEVIPLPPLFNPKQEAIHNFGLIKRGAIIGTSNDDPVRAEEDFYPILYGEVSYTNTLCWKGIKKS